MADTAHTHRAAATRRCQNTLGLLLACTTAAVAAGGPLPKLDREALQAKALAMSDDMLVPALGLLVRVRGEQFEFVHGPRERGGREPAQLGDALRVGSNTKTWTGTVILQLAQERQLDLADPVSKYVDDVPHGDEIHIEQLLNMRSGLCNYSETKPLNAGIDADPQRVWQPGVLLGLAFHDFPQCFSAAQGYAYSNTNTVLLGLIIEKLEKAPLATVFERRLFAPLKLRRTRFPALDDHALSSPRISGYMYGSNVLTMGTPPALPPAMQQQARDGQIQPRNWTEANPSWAWASGAGISTAPELATWVEALAGGGLLKPEWQARRMASVQPVDPANPDSAGYGWAIAQFGPMYGHTGELPGYNSFMGHDPVQRVTLIVWTSLAPAVDGRDPATSIAKALVPMIYGKAK